MLSYAFKALKQNNYKSLDQEEFDHVADLFAAILANGIAQQLKQGLHREYYLVNEKLGTLRGKLNLRETIKNRLQKKHQLACEYDELTTNNLLNQILKTTSKVLLKQEIVSETRRQQLKRNLMFFGDVDVLDISHIEWGRLTFHRNNMNYRLLINVCFLVLHSLILTESDGKIKLANFIDEIEMHNLYERFVFEYYYYHYQILSPASVQFDWLLEKESVGIEFLPKMKTDISLRDRNKKTLIIDTKFYSSSMQKSPYSEKQKFISDNLYQIFAYVKNTPAPSEEEVAGLLLYAKTVDDFGQTGNYIMSKNRIMVKTLDLNQDFSLIANQLDETVKDYFGDLPKRQ